MSCDCCVSLPDCATGLSAVCDCGISRSISLFLLKEENAVLNCENPLFV